MVKSEKYFLIKDTIFLGFSRYFSLFLGFFRGVILPRLISPEIYGIWKGLSLITDFSRLPQLGTASSLFRQIPILKANNKYGQIEDTVNTTFTINLSNAFLVGIIVFISSFFVSSVQLKLVLRLFSIIAFLNEIYMYQKIYFSSFKKFVFLSKSNIFDAFFSTFFVLFFTWKFQLNGLIIGTAIELFLITTILFFNFEIRPKLSINFSLLKILIKIGFPVMLSGIIMQLFLSIDKILILNLLGKLELGYYALGLTIINMSNQFFSTITAVVSPRLIEAYGHNKNIEDSRLYLTKTMFFLSYISPIFLLFLFFISDIIYDRYLPNYLPGKTSFHILLLSPFFLVSTNILSSHFIAIKKQHFMVSFQFVALFFALIGDYIAIHYFKTIVSVSIVTSVVIIIYSTSLISFTMLKYFIKKPLSFFIFIFNLYLPLFYSLLFILILSEFSLLQTNHLLLPFLLFFSFLLFYSPVAYRGYKIITNNIF